MISGALWHKEFGADRSVVGRRVTLDYDLYTIVGVLPPQFHDPSTPGLHTVDLWLTAGFRADPFPAPQRSVRDGMVPVLVGMAFGAIAAANSGRLLAALLFNINSVDGMVFACAGMTLIDIGLLANYIPARRAGRIDPVVALRSA